MLKLQLRPNNSSNSNTNTNVDNLSSKHHAENANAYFFIRKPRVQKLSKGDCNKSVIDSETRVGK